MTHKIHIYAKRLTDSSLVYDVHFRDVRFPAITENDAIALADKIAGAINDHSVDTAEAVIEWQEIMV
jgi:hypothetical protein